MKNSIFILAMVLLGGSILDAQVRESDNGKESVLDRFYFKAGAELFSYSSDNFSSRGGVNGMNLIGSFIYDYLDNIQMEFVYKHNIGRDHKSESMHFGTIDEYAYTSNYEEVLGNGIDLKVNYFLNRED